MYIVPVLILGFGLKKQSNTRTYKIFFKKERLFWLILVCDKNQTKFVQYHKCILCGYLRLDLDWKDNRILEPKTYFSNEEKKFILLILVCEKKPKLSVPHVYFVSVSILCKIFGCFLQRISSELKNLEDFFQVQTKGKLVSFVTDF